MSSDALAPAQHVSAIADFRLVTADLPRLCRFYQEVLGFLPDGREHAIAIDEMVLLGLRGSGRRQALRFGSQAVAIDQFTVPGQPYPDASDAASLCFQHLALVVPDIAAAYRRVQGAPAISQGGPQHLPATSGGVHAFKFRDPDGHPLELLQFPAGSRPPAWRGRSAAGQIGFGIDHSAISVADPDASVAFYRSLGLRPGERTVNHGSPQQHLDALPGVEVAVVPMQPATGTPHLELLGYRTPRGARFPASRPNDVVATRIVWRGTCAALLRDPDGHLQQVETS